MKRSVASILFVLALCPGIAVAKTLCVQNDSNGDVIVIKGIGKGSKPVSAYYGEFEGNGYAFRVMAGSAILSGNDLAVGLTEYGVGPGTFLEKTVIHRLRCNAGSDGKLGELDSCQDVMWSIPLDSQSSFNGHVIPCIPQLAIP
jgi:hypothetical protein